MHRALLASGLLFTLVAGLSAAGCSGSDGASGGTGGMSGGGTGGMSGGGTGGMSGGGTGGAAGPPFSDVQAILSQSTCRFCHSLGTGAMLPSAMNLGNDAIYASVVNVDSIECADMGGRKRVMPGDPEHSYLIDKLRGRNLCAGVQMPMSGTPLAESDIVTIENWIRAGARQ